MNADGRTPSDAGLSDALLLERATRSGRSVQEEAARALEAGECPLRYVRNAGTLSAVEQARLARATVLLAGCGGLGGQVLEQLVRGGVGRIIACDSDSFEPSNANRQLLCTPQSLGRNKAQVALERAALLNPLVTVRAVPERVTPELLTGVRVVADCLGGAEHRLELQRLATQAQVPLVSAGVSGWSALVSSTWPGETGLGEFMSGARQGSEVLQGVLAPTVSFAASLQAAELLRILAGQPPALRGSLLLADLAEMRFTTVSLQTGM